MGVLKGFLKSIGVIALVAIPTLGIWKLSTWQLQTAWQNHVEGERFELIAATETATGKLAAIYEGIRTISLLPSVRALNPLSRNISEDSRANIQQIYNNLKSSLDVSEIYILPADFNPQRLDSQTGKLQAPLAVFDELILHGGKYSALLNPFTTEKNIGPSGEPEIESEEYAAMQTQIAGFAKLGNQVGEFAPLAVPMSSSSELITCDNTIFNKTLKDADRIGIVFSVPYYSQSGEFQGMVSAILRGPVVAGFVRGEGFTLVTPSQHQEPSTKEEFVEYYDTFIPTLFRANAQWHLTMSNPLNTSDTSGQWRVNIKHLATKFYNSAGFREIQSFAKWSMSALFVAICLIGFVYLGNKRRNAALRFAATHDPLTGLPNRVLMSDLIDCAIRDGQNGKNEQQAILYLDLDKFKLVNDTLGHHIGDEVLKKAANVLSSCVRTKDFVARIGGDEFVMLITGFKSTDQIIAMATRITQEMKVPMRIAKHTILIGASIGIAIINKSAKDGDELLRHADLALFRTKQEERGNFRFYAPSMDSEREARRELESDLQFAVQSNQFVLHYQPILLAKSGVITGYEALVRWNHPKRGMVPPLSFIPIAEDIGLIAEIGEWVLRQACTDAMKLPHNLRMAVNLSPVQFKNLSLPLKVLNILNQTGLEPKRLELEITESVLLSDDSSTLEILNQLRDIGVRIALDDFGTGYSSLGYLKSFSFDKVKIDRSFLKNIEQAKEMIVLKAVTELGNSLGMSTVAEGVETSAQLEKVREHGCTEVQGYYFSRPLPIEQLLPKQNQQPASA